MADKKIKSSKAELKEVLGQVREDTKYKKFVRIVETAIERMHVETDRKEALALQSSRLSRQLTGSNRYSPKSLIDASIRDLQVRSRLVEIRVKAAAHIDLLDDACLAMRNHLYTEYQTELRMYSTEAQRMAFVKRVQGKAADIMTDGKALIEMLDHIIKDVDQASHLLRNVMECLKILDGTKGKIL